MKFFVSICTLLLLVLSGCSPVENQIAVTDAWVRATAPGQEVGAAYMTLQSNHDTSMIKAESNIAGSMEIHSMTMDDGVMKMRMLETLDLSAGKPFKLEPGGFHLMLFDLKGPLKAGESVNFTLHFKDKDGTASTIKLAVPVKAPSD